MVPALPPAQEPRDPTTSLHLDLGFISGHLMLVYKTQRANNHPAMAARATTSTGETRP
jgi:hypothetical protein